MMGGKRLDAVPALAAAAFATGSNERPVEGLCRTTRERP